MRKACRSEYTSHCGVARWIGGQGGVWFLCPGTREVPRSMLRFVPTGVHEKRSVRNMPDTSSCFGAPGELFRVAKTRRRSRGVGPFLFLFRFSSGFSPPDTIRSSGRADVHDAGRRGDDPTRIAEAYGPDECRKEKNFSSFDFRAISVGQRGASRDSDRAGFTLSFCKGRGRSGHCSVFCLRYR